MKNFTRYLALTCALILSPKLTNASALAVADAAAAEEVIRPGFVFRNEHANPINVYLTNDKGLEERFDLAGKPAGTGHSEIILNLLRDEAHRYATLTVTQGAKTLFEERIDTSALIAFRTNRSVLVLLERDTSPAAQVAPQFVIDEMLTAFAGLHTQRQNTLRIWEKYDNTKREELSKPFLKYLEEKIISLADGHHPSCLHCFEPKDVYPHNKNLLRDTQYTDLMRYIPEDATPDEHAQAEQKLTAQGFTSVTNPYLLMASLLLLWNMQEQ